MSWGFGGNRPWGLTGLLPTRAPTARNELELQQGRAELCRDRRLDKRDYLFIDMDFFFKRAGRSMKERQSSGPGLTRSEATRNAGCS